MTTGEKAGPALVLGPMLRYVSETEATIWVETDRECRVEVLGRGVPTFEVAGHHYGLVVVDGLAPGSDHEYQVALDGTVCWPLPGGDFPPSVLRTLGDGRPARLAFGSCRVTEIALENLSRPDALAACAATLPGCPRDRWPDVLLMIGDQVYADDPGRPPGASAPAAGRPGPTRARRPARSRTSRSTAPCTGRHGATRRSAGSSRSSRPR